MAGSTRIENFEVLSVQSSGPQRTRCVTFRWIPRIIFTLAVLTSTITGSGQTISDADRFHVDIGVGSHVQVNPLSVLLNMGFDITQLDKYGNDVFNYPYVQATKNVFTNLGRPLPLINEYGWGRFLRHEVFPLEFSSGASWWPNYQLHLVGGGATWVRLKEWYDDRGFPGAGWWAGSTVMIGHLLNEVMENNNVEGRLIDPIADIYLFDLGGILLFSSESVQRFFRDELQLSDWSLQPSLVLSDMTLRNAGQYFSIKVGIPCLEPWSLLYVFGLNGLLGVSHRFQNGEALSIAGGLRAREIHPGVDNPLRLTADLTWSGGFFWDRKGSLMASLVLSGISSNLVTLNVYPGLIEIFDGHPELWCTMTSGGRFMGGISTRWGPGIGW